MRLQWSNNDVEKRLREIVRAIHNQCFRFGEHDGFINHVDGANIAGFHKVAEAMLDQGLVQKPDSKTDASSPRYDTSAFGTAPDRARR